VKADVPRRDEELDLMDKEDFLFEGLSADGEDERIIPPDALMF
jgi:hypothetical protein